MTKTDGKHTPGPWAVTSRPDGLGGKDVIVKAGAVHVCDCFQGINGQDEEKANARLIAAAPEMREALEAVSNKGNWIVAQNGDRVFYIPDKVLGLVMDALDAGE